MEMQNSFPHTLLLILACFYFHSILIPTYADAELRALMEVKSSLDPENKYLFSWTSNGDPCGGSFEGVGCNEHRKVANISLQAKGLTGKVPPAVAELKCLSGLYLHYNSLSGEIPKEIANLTELTDLYLNVNNLSGSIPTEIGSMASLQVLQLSFNQLTGSMPTEIGFLKKLTHLALESNRLTGQIPASLGNLVMLKRLCLSFNQLSGPIPVRLVNIPQLEDLEVQNNTLSGAVPSGLRRLNEGFHFNNNPGLCGTGFPSLRACTPWDNVDINVIDSYIPFSNKTDSKNISDTYTSTCNQTHCSRSSLKLPERSVVAGVITLTVIVMAVVFIGIVRKHHRKQKVANKSDTSDDRFSIDHAKDLYKRSPSSLVSLEYSNGWDRMVNSQDCNGMSCHDFLQGPKFNLEEVESATQHFSEANLLGKSKFCAVYKGILKDGSLVAIKRISKTSCKTDEDEFMQGLRLLNSLKHGNLVTLKGFCCSKARGECFLVYEFASQGNLSQYLDAEDDSSTVLDWPTRVSTITGIAKGIQYLHSSETNKPPIIHQNISVEKVLMDQHFKPLIMDSGLLKLLADDVVYSALKASAALGYMAPEYITTGHFTEKSDVYAFGVIILQVLSGRRKLSSSIRMAAESGILNDFIDPKLEGKFSETEARQLTRIALECTQEMPEKRPRMLSVVEEWNEPTGG